MPASPSALVRKIEATENPHACGFCQSGNHDGCCVSVAKAIKGATWVCSCPECGGGTVRTRCMRCKNDNQQEVGSDYYCVDRDDCDARQSARLAQNPLYQQIRSIKEHHIMVKQESTTERKAAAPKVGKCLVTGEPTKGGKFKPGMDARYVSIAVANVLEKKETEAAARKRIASETESQALVGKFDKGLTLARAKAEKAKAVTAEKAKAKAEAKPSAPAATKA